MMQKNVFELNTDRKCLMPQFYKKLKNVFNKNNYQKLFDYRARW